MKKIIKVTVLLSIFSLTACSTNNMSSARPEVDKEYMKQVEAASRKAVHSPRIYWVNPPIKKSADTDTPAH